MDFRKIILYVALVIVALALWNAWQREFPPMVKSQPTTIVQTKKTPTVGSSVPVIQQNTSTKQASSVPLPGQLKASDQFIHVKTDVLDIIIDTHGGNIEQAKLLHYPQSQKTPQRKMELFNTKNNTFYVAQSGLTGKQGPDTQKGLARYHTVKKNYILLSGKNTLIVPLTWKNSQGLTITKTYTFHRGSYAIDMGYHIKNNTSKSWTGYVYTQLSRKKPEHSGSLLTHYATFTGAAISSPQNHYQKLKFKNFADEPINNKNIQGGWAAMIQHYFLSAWIPPAQQNYHYFTKVNNLGVYTVGMIGPALTVHSGDNLNTENKLYVGPAIASNLDKLSPHLSMAIDYGWLWFISKIIFWIMKLLHAIVGNWGWSIILTTIIIKLLFYPLSDKSFRSMANMRKLQPKMAQLKERFADDRQAMGRATMELYRKEKVNPLSGCLPIIVQIPVFIALYWVIIQSVELRQAPWLFWIKNLSVHDPYYILPVLMGGLMFVQQKLSPPPPDPTQAKVMMLMPVIFTVFFLSFPSGLVLYWITNTLATIAHQYYVIKRTERADKAKKQKR